MQKTRFSRKIEKYSRVTNHDHERGFLAYLTMENGTSAVLNTLSTLESDSSRAV